MIKYSRAVIICLLALMFTGIIPVAHSDDVDLWSDVKQLTHSYYFSAPVITGEWFYLSSFGYSAEHGWSGNLKKFRFIDEGKVIDQNGISVFNCQGNALSEARSFWASTITDSRQQDEVHTILTTQSMRRLFTSGVKNQQFQLVRLSEEQQKAIPSWLGDSMHSQPRILDYGFQHQGRDRRILLGTNHGILHLFSDKANTVSESWAFIPAEFLSHMAEQPDLSFKSRRYGLDGVITVFHDDKDRDGVIEAAEGDRLWIFFGLRQGGRSYYALDLTDPDHPSLKWKIDGNDADGAYRLLGETWSEPQLVYLSDKNSVSASSTPVVIVAGGYMPHHRRSAELSVSVGKAIYFIDADSGKKLFSISPEANGQTNLQAPLTDAIPATVAVLENERDGSSDRLYVGDMGGNVWRLDMSGHFSDWRMSKLAALGGGDSPDGGHGNNAHLRFFGQPVIVRSLLRVKTGTDAVADVPADWVLMGSGNRAEPANDVAHNRYFALPDRQITPYQPETAIPAPLQLTDLHPAYSQNNDQAPADALMRGWYLNLDPAQHEQVFGNGYVIAGTAWFSSFSPSNPAAGEQTSIGVTRLYKIDLASGSFHGTAAVSQFYDRLLENPGLAYQAKKQQLWLSGVTASSTDCASQAVRLEEALKPRKVAEY